MAADVFEQEVMKATLDRVPSIPRELNRQDELIASLEKQLEALDNKLNSVLVRSSAATAIDPVKESTIMSPLAERIDGHNARLMHLSDGLSYLTQGLEL